jgi:ryanodine receptor 2
VFRVLYQPRPIDTTNVQLPSELTALIERLAENTHDTWASLRLAEGWIYGPRRDDERKQHPGLVMYAELSEAEKDYDRATAVQALKAVVALGYRIEGGVSPVE